MADWVLPDRVVKIGFWILAVGSCSWLVVGSWPSDHRALDGLTASLPARGRLDLVVEEAGSPPSTGFARSLDSWFSSCRCLRRASPRPTPVVVVRPWKKIGRYLLSLAPDRDGFRGSHGCPSSLSHVIGEDPSPPPLPFLDLPPIIAVRTLAAVPMRRCLWLAVDGDGGGAAMGLGKMMEHRVWCSSGVLSAGAHAVEFGPLIVHRTERSYNTKFCI
ncbi:hypothetical protein ACLOJK_028228 [Asimina triloba]